MHAELRAGVRNGLPLGLAAVVLLLPLGDARTLAPAPSAGVARAAVPVPVPATLPVAATAAFGDSPASSDVRAVADWIAASRDNGRRAFAILDKRAARLYVFDAEARLGGSTLVLLGSATGDDSVPGIGERPLAQVRAAERTTAAGRFVSVPGHDDQGEPVVWVDYAAALAMHRVKVVDPAERRFERIATDSVADKRISNGCINVPLGFFDDVVEPALGHAQAIVYVLPERKPLQAVFPAAHAHAARAQPPDPAPPG